MRLRLTGLPGVWCCGPRAAGIPHRGAVDAVVEQHIGTAGEEIEVNPAVVVVVGADLPMPR